MLVCWQSNPHLYPALRRKIAAALHQACHLKTHLGTRGRLRLQTRPTLVSRAAETSLQRQHLHRSCLQKKACMRRQEVKAESVSMGKCTAMETTTCGAIKLNWRRKYKAKSKKGGKEKEKEKEKEAVGEEETTGRKDLWKKLCCI